MRRFYSFNSVENVSKHVSDIKSVADLMQLDFDIKASQTNLTKLQAGNPGIWCLYCVANEPMQAWLFITREAMDQIGEFTSDERSRFDHLIILES